MKTAVGPFVIVNMIEYNIICSNKATSRGRAMRCRVEKRASKRFRVGAAAMTPWSPTASPLHVRTETTVCLIGTVLITHSRPFQFHPLTSFGACICTWLQRKVATVGPEHRLSALFRFVSFRTKGPKGPKLGRNCPPKPKDPFLSPSADSQFYPGYPSGVLSLGAALTALQRYCFRWRPGRLSDESFPCHSTCMG
jgi:hypothetical protein